jgi:glucosamine kinase
MMHDVVVGVDIGGTKTHLRVEGVDGGRLTDVVFQTTSWRAQPNAEKAIAIRSWVEAVVEPGRVAAIAVGAHGCDTQDECRQLRHEVHALLQIPTVVVNDAQLLGPAAGDDASIQLIAGTGSIAAGQKRDGENVFAGGWGWLVGDEGGAAGLVRGAVARLARGKDEHVGPELLEAKLLAASGATDLREMSMRMMMHGGTEFAQWAPAVFDAADEGSELAADVIRYGAAQLVKLVGNLLSEQVVADRVIAAGSVVVNQSRLAELLRMGLSSEFGLELTVLRTDPVAGAIRLALRELEATPCLTTGDRTSAPL